MHQKEKVIAPIMERELGLQLIVPPDFDTDAFGTFTRETKRRGSQLDAARYKAQTALEVTGATIALASEGSFGPHPSVPWVPANREIVLLIDQQQGLEIVGEEFSLETNYNNKQVSSLPEALEFADRIGFPEHGLVVMDTESPEQRHCLFKGITTETELWDAIAVAIAHSPSGKAHIETDMRAMYNPTRMKNIAKATLNLVATLKRLCPACATPGFQATEARQGLACALCGFPTTLTKSLIYQCRKCQFTQEELFPNGVQSADPSQCQYCNP